MTKTLPGCTRVGNYLIHTITALWGKMWISRVTDEGASGPSFKKLCELPKKDWYAYPLSTEQEIETYLATRNVTLQ